MSMTKEKQLNGRHVLMIFGGAFSVIIAVNLTLAFNAVSTFPGLEVKNSYVASQGFDAARDAQLALGWDVRAVAERGNIRLEIMKGGAPVEAEIRSAVLGRATNVAQDQFPTLAFDGRAYVAPAELSGGNWNLRLVAVAADGTEFKQRIIVDVVR